MNIAGQYGQPFTRPTWAEAVIVSQSNGTATTTLRLCASNMNLADSGANRMEHAVLVTARNHSGTEVVFQINQCANTLPTAPRTQLGNIFDLQIRGEVTQTIFPTQPYLEVKGIAGNGQVRLELNSRLIFTRMSFDKLDYVYPQSLTAIVGLPSFASLNTGVGNIG